MSELGRPRLHLRLTDSTNARARALAAAGAPHGTLVTAREQSAGRGRQGRTWVGPPGAALLASLVIRSPPRLLPLLAGVAVAEIAAAETGAAAGVKWPNDVLIEGRKVAGILVEGRPQEDWAVLGLGINVAVDPRDLPEELHDRAGTLRLGSEAIEPVLSRLLDVLATWLSRSENELLGRIRALDVLLGEPVRWGGGEGSGAGIDGDGRLIVVGANGSRRTLEAGEVHLAPRR